MSWWTKESGDKNDCQENYNICTKVFGVTEIIMVNILNYSLINKKNQEIEELKVIMKLSHHLIKRDDKYFL